MEQIIDLSGPQGNAYYLLSVAKDLCEEHKLDWNQVEKDMTSSSYGNLLKVFRANFRDYYILINE